MYQLSNINLWNKDNQKLKLMYNARENMMKFLSYVDFEKPCIFIKYFPHLNQKFGKEDITLSLLSSSRSIEWRKIYLKQFRPSL